VFFYFFNSSLLLEKLERALLRDVACLLQVLERLLAKRMLLLADNAALLCLHQMASGQTTGCVFRGAVPDLGLRADRRDLLGASLHCVVGFAILTRYIRTAHGSEVLHF
jgi:hypothetical protein